MNSSRQPLLTLSPSQHVHIGSPKVGRTEQTTPKLPKRERLASFSRLLKNENFSELTEKPAPLRRPELRPRALIPPSVDIRISPCSPPDTRPVEEDTPKWGRRFLSPNYLPFSPRLLSRESPVCLSPNYRRPSPVRSPLYSPENRHILGRGSFGKVNLCKYKDTAFAVKVIYHPTGYAGESNLLGIRHPHLVEIFHISSVLDKTLIFMEFAGHCNLQQVLDTKSELDFRRRLSFCIQTASGLRHCHQKQIIHGDVKPANVMVSTQGICKLGDFGLSARADVFPESGPSHFVQDAVGTAAYAAPEVLKGFRPGLPSDVYSFGILLWQVQTREVPFAGEHPHVIIYKVVNYGTRPKFSEDGEIPILSQYVRLAEDCWRAVPTQRVDSDQALSALQAMLKAVKEANGN